SWRKVSTSWTSKPRNIRTVNCCCRMSMGVIRTVSSSVQRRQDHSLEELDGDEHDERREGEAARLPRGQEIADGAEHGLGRLVEELHDRVPGIRAHPGDERGGDDHPG